uniref:Uncharacterized protein TCIL3000_4_2690 n=1 Tax=Trypanosoma congolense (strain IL3000) TaxID=1068625 RepID=G0ULC3_TRYCI|nr:unnamed protein product [Trypanosoma congolense IL3000]
MRKYSCFSIFGHLIVKPQRVHGAGCRGSPLRHVHSGGKLELGEHSKREEVQSVCRSLLDVMATLLTNRQCLYRDAVLHDALNPHRRRLQCLLEGAVPDTTATGTPKELTTEKVLECRDYWKISVRDGISTLVDFYNAFLMSNFVNSHSDVQVVLDVMQQSDHIDPTAETYTAIMLSFISLRKGPNPVIGDTAFHYFGHALKTRGESFITPELWGALFVACAVVGAAEKLVEQWWDLMLKVCEGASVPLPFGAVHAALTWCSSRGDIERALRFFQAAKSKSLILFTPEGTPVVIESGGLMNKSASTVVQHFQLRLIVKLMVTTKAVEHDGGLRALVVDDVRRLIDPAVLQRAEWGVINDLISGLSLQSAMQLLKFRSAKDPEGDGAVPFTLWASLLRRCARDHHIDQAESLFLFIRKRFELLSEQKAELVEIMMRMFATLPQGDFASAMALFVEHVLDHPPAEPAVEPNTTMYNLLIRAADTRNAAMMTFLEACSAGIEMNMETFESLCRSNRFGTIASLSRKLPYDYHASKLDQQLRIPSNIDAHLRREEAMKLRGKPLVDSTGEVN